MYLYGILLILCDILIIGICILWGFDGGIWNVRVDWLDKIILFLRIGLYLGILVDLNDKGFLFVGIEYF